MTLRLAPARPHRQPEEHLDFLRRRGGRRASCRPRPGARVKSRVAPRVARLVRPRRRAGRRRAGALPPAAEGQALPRLPPRGPGHRLGRPTTSAPGWPRWPRTSRARARSASGWARRWSPAAGAPPQVKDGIADDAVRRLGDVPPDRARAQPAPAWSPSCASSAGGRRRSRAASPPASRSTTSRSRCATPTATPRTEDDVLAGMNQLWRRNIKKAAKAGVEVTARRRRRRDLKAFHDLYVAHRRARPLHARGRCPTSRPCSTRCSAEEPDRIRLYLARHEGDLVAATICDPRRRATPGTPTAPPPPRSATSAAPTPSSGR